MFASMDEIVDTKFPQINAQMGNAKAPQTIYISTDPADNDISLLLAPTQNAALRAATPCPPDEAARASGTLFYIDLSNMGLTAAEFDALGVSARGWQCRLYAKERSICLAPAEDMTLQSGPGNGQCFAVAGFAIANAPSTGSANLTVSYYRVADFTTGDLPAVVSLKVLFQQPPDRHDGNLQDVIALDLDSGSVAVSLGSTGAVPNGFDLTFGPGRSQTQVPAGPETRFVISFVYAGDEYGYGALSTVAEAVDFELTAGLNAGNWIITPGTDHQNPSWILQPPQDQPIVGMDTKAAVGFHFANIVTRFRPGPTLMYVSYSGVGGYKDGAFARFLMKQDPEPRITAYPWWVAKGGQTTLTWVVPGADKCILDPGRTMLSGPCGTTSRVVDEDTTFRLHFGGSEPVTCEVIVMPVAIRTFKVAPEKINIGEKVTLEWDVRYASSCSIQPEIGEVNAFGAKTIAPKDTTRYVLTGRGLQEQSAEATVEVEFGVVKIRGFSVSPQEIYGAGTVTVSWATTEATRVVLSVDGTPHDVAPSGAETFDYGRYAGGPASFVLSCEGPGGPVASDTISVSYWARGSNPPFTS